MRARALIAAVVLTAGCEGYPRDPEGTLDAARGGTLHVGVTAAPPWVVRVGETPEGPEPALVQAFAASIGATVAWEWGPVDAHLLRLERFELAVVVAGLDADSPWQKRVGFTRPHAANRVLAVPPGENALLVALDRFVQERRR